ncbi:MAG: signal peptidase I [Candidatus Vogelbacteria bacterium]|nr:signal peptidase I [Candidatus Vogelbacteria bacterium]
MLPRIHGREKMVTFLRFRLKKLIHLTLVALTAALIFSFVLSPVFVSGQSMEPTYREGEFILINRLGYLIRSPERGEIVAIKLAGRHLMLMKRIIGLPGETVELRNGQVFINDRPLVEPYLISPESWDLPPRVLTAEEYFVIGDNRRQTMEKHFFGRVKAKQIVGRALW